MRRGWAVVQPLRDATRGAKLLVVDDEPLVRRALARTLTRRGYEVAEASDGGAEALDVLAAHPEVKCVVTDVAMPGLDGRALAERLAVSASELPVVLVSGNSVPRLDGPRRAFLAKPVPEGALVATVERLLG